MKSRIKKNWKINRELQWNLDLDTVDFNEENSRIQKTFPRSNLRRFDSIRNVHAIYNTRGCIIHNTEWPMHLAAPRAIDILWLNAPLGVVLAVHRFTVARHYENIKPRYISSFDLPPPLFRIPTDISPNNAWKYSFLWIETHSKRTIARLRDTSIFVVKNAYNDTSYNKSVSGMMKYCGG